MENKNISVGNDDQIWIGHNRGIHERGCHICEDPILASTKFADIEVKRTLVLRAHVECIAKLEIYLDIFCKEVERAKNPPPKGEKE